MWKKNVTLGCAVIDEGSLMGRNVIVGYPARSPLRPSISWKPLTMENTTWLVVGAGSVVTEDVPANIMVMGSQRVTTIREGSAGRRKECGRRPDDIKSQPWSIDRNR